LEGVKPHTHRGIIKRATEPEHTDPVHLPRLLRLGGKRRGEEATGQAPDERPPVDHSIT
jgi:hypothetical protein